MKGQSKSFFFPLDSRLVLSFVFPCPVHRVCIISYIPNLKVETGMQTRVGNGGTLGISIGLLGSGCVVESLSLDHKGKKVAGDG